MATAAEQTLVLMTDLNKKLTAHEAPARKAYEAAQRNMKQAIDSESEDAIQLARDDVKAAQFKIDQCLHSCQQLHEYTDVLQKDRDFLAAHRAAVVKIVTHFGPLQKEMGKWSKELRELDAKALKAESVAKQGAAETETDLGALKNFVTWVEAANKKFAANKPRLEKDARADPASKAAEQARLKLIDLNREGDEALVDAQKAFREFAKNHPDVDAGVKRELQDAAATIGRGEDIKREGNALLLELLKLKQTAAASAKKTAPPAPIVVSDADLKKLVAPIVGIDPKDSKAVTELGKLLKDTPPNDWGPKLGTLAGKYKSKNTNGKGMALEIQKLAVVKKQMAAAAP